MIYFTSDLHFGHKSILEFEHNTRGHFESIEEMDNDLIEQWNKLITEEDTVYFLGDFSFNSKKKEIVKYLEKLNFKELICIYGNHDNEPFRKAIKEFDNVVGLWGDRLKANGKILFLSHYPMFIGNRPDLFSIHGHLHSKRSPESTYMINVGFDYTGKIAIGLDELLEILEDKEKDKTAMREWTKF